jgi:glycosyltransferase involved in cell wall biosynthesis
MRHAEILKVDERITWAGMLGGDLKWGAFHTAELFCLPSHQENFGIVVAEALGCGLPVAISEAVNIAHEVRKAGAGLVYQDTIEGTTSAINRWLDMTSSERILMGNRGKQLFKQKFDFATVARNLLPVIKNN